MAAALRLHSRRLVCESDSALCRVHMLPARATGPHVVDAHIRIIDLVIDTLGLLGTVG